MKHEISTSNDQVYGHKLTMVTVCTGMPSSRKNCQAIYLQSINFAIYLTNMCLFASAVLGQVNFNTGTRG